MNFFPPGCIYNNVKSDGPIRMAASADQIYFTLLVIRCQAGDARAYAELIAATQPALLGYLRKILLDPHTADDVAQEVWIDVFGGLKNLKEPAAFLPWMYKIAHHRAFGLLRKRQRPMESIDALPIGSEDDADDFTAEDAAEVHAAMDRLQPEHREVLLLRFMHQMSYEQIADVAGCQIGTVRSRIHNAKKQLRHLIEKAGTI